MSDLDERRIGRWILLGSPLLLFALEFGSLYVTYLVAPDSLAPVADRPAAYAALIALVALPMHVALLSIIGWKAVKALLTGAEPPDAPVRTGWRRLGEYVIGLLPNIAAAVIVFETDATLLLITILGPVALFLLFRGLGVLRRPAWRRWTNRGHQPRHNAPGGPET